jgi:hypothetical protein
MKIKTLCCITLLLLLAISTSAPKVAHASDWVEDLFTCTGNYIDSANTAWDNWENSPQEPEDEWELNHALDDSFYGYQACNNMTTAPQLDFCTSAMNAAANCSSQYSGLDYWDAYMACRAASGIDSCQ